MRLSLLSIRTFCFLALFLFYVIVLLRCVALFANNDVPNLYKSEWAQSLPCDNECDDLKNIMFAATFQPCFPKTNDQEVLSESGSSGICKRTAAPSSPAIQQCCVVLVVYQYIGSYLFFFLFIGTRMTENSVENFSS